MVTSTGVVRGALAADRAGSSLDAVHYADRCTLATGVEAGAEEWARALFGDVPSPAEVLIWRVLLGFRLDPRRSPDTVAGWRVGERAPDRIRLETASASLSAEMVVRTAGRRVTWTTSLRYDRPWGRLLWPPLSAVHRRLVPRVLAAAERELARR
ncbi:DUF2867 domain-containing protein [Geodermatophilus sp. FMUSA9-8]|uniref:DUF2867 domain-containing protein n=1 Tax=Geodermatophilus sp. FMUSA9-8 TaxID=3120155 RepID=UPI00300985ED